MNEIFNRIFFCHLPLRYTRARLSTMADDFKNKTYLLVHGSLDDNVHYQQSMALVRTLELNDVPFEQIVRSHQHSSLENC